MKLAVAGIAAGVAVLAGLVGWYRFSYPTNSYRYRLTVNVEVDGQLRSGSGVLEVVISEQPAPLPTMNRISRYLYGDAVFVDLGGNRNVVALLATGEFARNAGLPNYAVRHFKVDLDRPDQVKSLSQLRGTWSLTPAEFPALITLSNPADPKSIRMVAPDQFAEAFGPGVRLRDITIEMTTVAVTREIDTYLPWVRDLATGRRADTVTTARDGFALNAPYFRINRRWL